MSEYNIDEMDFDETNSREEEIGEKDSNTISISKKQIWKYSSIVLLVIVVGFFMFRGGQSGLVTGNVVGSGGDDSFDVKTTLQGFKYNPDTIIVKEGSQVRLTIDNKDNVNHGLHLPQFGIVEGIPPKSVKTVSFVAVKTSTNGLAVPTCSQEHGETLTINVI